MLQNEIRDDNAPSQAFRVDTLEPGHYRDLLKVRANPRFNLQPSRRDMFRRIGLIKPAEPARKPGHKLKAPSPRAFNLTDTGHQVLDQWLKEGGK